MNMATESNQSPVGATVVDGISPTSIVVDDIDTSLVEATPTHNESLPVVGVETATFTLADPPESLLAADVVDSPTTTVQTGPSIVTPQNTQSIPPPPRTTIRMRLHGLPPQNATSTTASINPPNVLNRIPLQFHHNQVHLNLGNGSRVMVPLQRQNSLPADGITTASGRHGNVNIRVVQVDPLVPQPIESTGTLSARLVDNVVEDQRQTPLEEEDPSLSRFKCDICFDFLRVIPVGCGKCSARFCQDCLQRVYSDEARRLQPHKCPMCRVEYQHIVPDETLQQEMDSGPTVPCRYDGCPQKFLRLSMIASHEQTCEHVPVRCRFATYGCMWTGKRGMIQDHQQNSCRVAPIGPFVEQFRQLKAEVSGRTEMAAQRADGAVRMQGILRQSFARDQIKSAFDFLHLLQYCQSLTCCTPTALLQKEKWLSYWRNDETRASVVNFLMFIPFLIPAITIGSQGLASFGLFMDKFLLTAIMQLLMKDSNSTLASEDVLFDSLTPPIERLLELTFIGFCTTMFGALLIALNLLDEKSSKVWRGINLGQFGTHFIIRDVLGICIFALFMCVMEYHDSGVRAMMLWTLVLFTSTFFPSVVLTLSHFMATTDPPLPNDLPSLARSVEPLLFGLRYSCLEAYFGLSACLDAALIVGLWPRSDQNKLLNDCFLGQVPEVARVAFLGFKVAFWGTGAYSQFSQNVPLIDVLSSIVDSFSAAIALQLANELVRCLFTFGIKVGCLGATQSRSFVRPEGVTKDYCILGIVAFGTWCAAIFAISRL
jgi:hypothetical protein